MNKALLDLIVAVNIYVVHPSEQRYLQLVNCLQKLRKAARNA